MKILIFGAGNILLSDEGFGVHFVRYLEENYDIPENVELYDGGTMGIMVTHKFEEADRVYLIDTVESKEEPGAIFRYEKNEIMLGNLPLKLSPHQIGIQEVLTLSELRGRCPECLTFFGVVAESLEPGVELSLRLERRLEELAGFLVAEMAREGVILHEKSALPET